MKTINFPPPQDWESLCSRPEMMKADLEKKVSSIIEDVKIRGDKALFEYGKQFDGVALQELKVTPEEIEEALLSIPEEFKNAISLAKSNIEKFHLAQLKPEPSVETSPGVTCWRKNVPIEKVGLYVPGGTAPLFSTVLMLGIPAKLAGCTEITMCTPPGKNGKINPLILYAAYLTGVNSVFKAGGAQAIAAMAFGTESVTKVYKIFGPGNQFVTRAKELVQLQGTAIDMPAGPSELLVIADSTANPEFIAADLLSQAEHGPDSQVLFLTDDKALAKKVIDQITKQLPELPRKEIAEKALEKSLIIILHNIDECISFSNLYAPEHLIITTADPSDVGNKVINAGSVFIGKYSCESAGDYASGTNHTLPTNRYARISGGVSADSFVRKITFQEITTEGIKNIGPAIEIMAESENLSAHKNAVSVRLKSIRNV